MSYNELATRVTRWVAEGKLRPILGDKFRGAGKTHDSSEVSTISNQSYQNNDPANRPVKSGTVLASINQFTFDLLVWLFTGLVQIYCHTQNLLACTPAQQDSCIP